MLPCQEERIFLATDKNLKKSVKGQIVFCLNRAPDLVKANGLNRAIREIRAKRIKLLATDLNKDENLIKFFKG
jgi:hypothetical protein